MTRLNGGATREEVFVTLENADIINGVKNTFALRKINNR